MISRIPPELLPLASSMSTPPFDVKVPEPDCALHGFTAEPWLLRLVNEHAGAPSPVTRVASLGVIARLWTPARASEVSAALDAVGSGFPMPVDRVRLWAAALPRETVESLAFAITSECDMLAALLPEVERGTGGFRVAWLHRRDDLESVAEVIRMRCWPEAIGAQDAALRDLDRDAAGFSWACDEVRTDPRLLTVAWCEPDKWWGRVATD